MLTPDERDEIKRLVWETSPIAGIDGLFAYLDSLTGEGTTEPAVSAPLAAVRALPERWRALAAKRLRDAPALDMCVYELLAALGGTS